MQHRLQVVIIINCKSKSPRDNFLKSLAVIYYCINKGLCPHMKNPRLCRGIPILNIFWFLQRSARWRKLPAHLLRLLVYPYHLLAKWCVCGHMLFCCIYYLHVSLLFPCCPSYLSATCRIGYFCPCRVESRVKIYAGCGFYAKIYLVIIVRCTVVSAHCIFEEVPAILPDFDCKIAANSKISARKITHICCKRLIFSLPGCISVRINKTTPYTGRNFFAVAWLFLR